MSIFRRTVGLIVAVAWLTEIGAAAGGGSDSKRDTAAPAPVVISSLPKLRSGVAAYPPPFMAVARTPYVISPLGGKTIDIQTDFGYPGGFSGFVDAAIGSIGYPGYRNFTNLDIAYDTEKLCLLVSVPYPLGRKTRANAADPSGDLLADDVFEILIDPRDGQGRSKGPVYRLVGNAAAVGKFDLDLPQIGQVHQPWQTTTKYGSMTWDPQGSWLAALQISFNDLGGAPHDSDTWGVQMALRYADPKITAVLSPSDDFGDRSRFARIRFDANRRANYRCHWLSEDEIKAGKFCVGGIFSNGANEATRLNGTVTIYKGDREIGGGSFAHDARPLNKYDGDMPPVRFPSQPAAAGERDTVARVLVIDQQAGATVYDQFVPYWRAAPGERDWLKQHFAKEFTFQIGPYPSRGDIEYAIDCQTLREAMPTAARGVVSVSSGGKELTRSESALPPDGKFGGTLHVGRMTDGARYEIIAAICDKDSKTLSTKMQTFTRTVMPFETAPRAGLSDLVPPPFTPPSISGSAVSCVGRVYTHGSAGLLESLVAAGNELLAAPATLQVRTGTQPTIALRGGAPSLTPRGKGQVDYRQTFSGGGLTVDVAGVFDYDGFYRFSARLAPAAGPVDLQECRLELPLRAAHATFMEAPIDSLERDFDKGAGLLDAKQGRVWDSKHFPFAARNRKGNMPPYCWIGDDDCGLCYSCASDQGMHNDDALPAVAVDREGQRVVLRAWFVNRPLTLKEPRTFEFALQASPFKPLDPAHRLWRCGVSREQCCYGASGRYFHTGWGIGDYWPTYGRFLDLAKNAEAIRGVRASGYDYIAASASSCSECGGTPDYKQFWREWGSELGWDQAELGPLPEWMDKHMKDSGVPYDRYVAVESASNSSPSNVDYRAWWFAEVARHCQTSMIYQDNPPYSYFYQPAIGYGYTRDDGVREPTCATWNARDFMRRALHIAVESGSGNPAPGVYPNVCGAAQPGRSFSFRGLTGEWLQSDRLPLSTLRVWLSQQWGMNIDWLMQEPTAGATLKYWRALCSRLFLLDVTSFSRMDTADVANSWLTALDLFWLDDPTVVWHPYYRNPTLQSTIRPTTLVSTYTAKGRALFVISNQGADGVVEAVAFKNLEKYGAGGLQYFYDSESGEEIENAGKGVIRLHISGNDYRLVLGFTKPWRFAVKHAQRQDDLPAQSSLDASRTVTALCKQLLVSPKPIAIEDGHRLTETWVQKIVAAFQSDPADFVYLDRTACADVDLGDKQIQTALLYSKKRQVLLAVYLNPTDTDRLLKGSAREALNKKVNRQGYTYVLDPIRGTSQWNVIDLPAGGGKLEFFYSDAADYSGARWGPFALGTLWTNLRERSMPGRKKWEDKAACPARSLIRSAEHATWLNLETELCRSTAADSRLRHPKCLWRICLPRPRSYNHRESARTSCLRPPPCAMLHRIENRRVKTFVWLIVTSLAAIPWTRQAKGDDPAEVYSRICQEYLDGKWDALDADLRAAKNSAGLSAAQQADVTYIRQAVAECRPPWWTQTKAGKKVAIRPVVWGQPLNFTYDPAGQGGVQAHYTGNTMSLTASWPAAEMDNSDQAEHGFTKGELNNLSVWTTLGMARVWSQTPPQALAGLSEAGKLRLLRCQDFRGAVTGLYYGYPRARRWGEFLYLLSWLEKYAKMPTVYSRKAAGAMFLAEVLANPGKYPSLPLPKTLAAENAEEKLAEYYRTRIEKSGWSVAEDRSLRDTLKKFAAANDLSVYKTQAVTLPNKLVVALDPDADTSLRPKRDAWLKARFDEAKDR